KLTFGEVTAAVFAREVHTLAFQRVHIGTHGRTFRLLRFRRELRPDRLRIEPVQHHTSNPLIALIGQYSHARTRVLRPRRASVSTLSTLACLVQRRAAPAANDLAAKQ